MARGGTPRVISRLNMAKKSVCQQIYTRLDKLTGGIIPFLESGEALHIANKPHLDLHIDALDNGRISMAHTYIHQTSMVVADSDMEILINPKAGTAEAVTYQNINRFDAVCDNPRLKKELNTFLLQWLKDIEEQGFIKVKKGF